MCSTSGARRPPPHLALALLKPQSGGAPSGVPLPLPRTHRGRCRSELGWPPVGWHDSAKENDATRPTQSRHTTQAHKVGVNEHRCTHLGRGPTGNRVPTNFNPRGVAVQCNRARTHQLSKTAPLAALTFCTPSPSISPSQASPRPARGVGETGTGWGVGREGGKGSGERG
jgi:hypothetical protein